MIKKLIMNIACVLSLAKPCGIVHCTFINLNDWTINLQLRLEHCTLMHSLISALPVNEMVTTN